MVHNKDKTGKAANPERRKYPRVNTPEAVANCRLLSAQAGGGRFQFAVWPLRNMSAAGVALACEEEIAAGSLIFVNIDLDIIRKTVGAIAKVVWCQKREANFESGLNFCLWPKKEDEKLLAQYIDSRMVYDEPERKIKVKFKDTNSH